MNRTNLSASSFKNRSVHQLGNMGDEDETVNVEVECDDVGDVNIRTIKKWIKQGGCKTLAEAPFRNGPEGLEVWNQAFPNFESKEYNFHDNCFNIFYDDGTPGPREMISVSITRATVELEDGTVHDEVFYVTFNRSAGTPDEVIIMQRN